MILKGKIPKREVKNDNTHTQINYEKKFRQNDEKNIKNEYKKRLNI